ncbi:ABC transporter ATP-binding protein [Aerococcus viridans]|uniref:ABC transporter ATP-binding protein n=1 Tax=Aerococcus viridans TaxID=1377 RepID=UPI003B20F79B
MAKVQLNKVGKIYEDEFKAIHNIDLDIEDKEFIVFVGPSGCGKSTTLRMIAGLETISEGELRIGDEVVNNVPAKDRDIAMVFQSYALYPHMNVRDNIAFAMKMEGISKKERYAKVEEVARPLQLTEYLDKKPSALSGGQRQRVALGRAMVRNPKVFLLDEPLSNLDAKLRVSMRSEIVELHHQLQTTFIYVTHDQTEAMTMGTRIAVLNAGRVEQFDTPENLYNNPVNRFVAEFIGNPQMNLINGRLVKTKNGTAIESSEEIFPLPQEMQDNILVEATGQEIQIGLRPEHFEYKNNRFDNQTILVQTKNVEQVGADTFVYFDFHSSEREMTARLSPAKRVPTHADVYLQIDINKAYLFDKTTGNSILNRRYHEE